jgi:hypothetical protein
MFPGCLTVASFAFLDCLLDEEERAGAGFVGKLV